MFLVNLYQSDCHVIEYIYGRLLQSSTDVYIKFLSEYFFCNKRKLIFIKYFSLIKRNIFVYLFTSPLVDNNNNVILYVKSRMFFFYKKTTEDARSILQERELIHIWRGGILRCICIQVAGASLRFEGALYSHMRMCKSD